MGLAITQTKHYDRKFCCHQPCLNMFVIIWYYLPKLSLLWGFLIFLGISGVLLIQGGFVFDRPPPIIIFVASFPFLINTPLLLREVCFLISTPCLSSLTKWATVARSSLSHLFYNLNKQYAHTHKHTRPLAKGVWQTLTQLVCRQGACEVCDTSKDRCVIRV